MNVYCGSGNDLVTQPLIAETNENPVNAPLYLYGEAGEDFFDLHWSNNLVCVCVCVCVCMRAHNDTGLGNGCVCGVA